LALKLVALQRGVGRLFVGPDVPRERRKALLHFEIVKSGVRLTILEEYWPPSFARSLVPKLAALRRDCDECRTY
jgi:hypothetical protein